MPNNIAVGISVDVADLTAKRAILSSELKAATKDLNDFANTARTSGMTDELRASMLASADAVGKLKAQVVAVTAEMKTAGTASVGFGASIKNAMKGATEEIEGIRGLVSGFGEALLAVFAVGAIGGFAEKMAKTAEETLHTAETF